MLYFLYCSLKALTTTKKSQTAHTGVVTPGLKTIGLAYLDCLTGCFDIEEQR